MRRANHGIEDVPRRPMVDSVVVATIAVVPIDVIAVERGCELRPECAMRGACRAPHEFARLHGKCCGYGGRPCMR